MRAAPAAALHAALRSAPLDRTAWPQARRRYDTARTLLPTSPLCLAAGPPALCRPASLQSFGSYRALLAHCSLRGFAGQGRQTLYEVLGVPPTATQQEIKRAYLKEAKESHPDVNKSPDATRRFQALAEAYNVLGNPDRRAAHDAGPSPSESSTHYSGSGARRSNWSGSVNSEQQDQEPVDASRLFRAVLEELGADKLMQYFKGVQEDASEAASKAKEGDMQPTKDFVLKHKGLAAMVLLPAIAIFRFPGLVAAALRLAGIAGLLVFQAIARDPNLQRALGRFAWYSWRLLRSRAEARVRQKKP